MDVSNRRSSRYIALLAVAATLILVTGWLLRPRDIPQSPPPVPSETELRELARRTERRSLENMTGYFADVATDVRASVAYMPSVDASAVIWDGEHLVTGPMTVPPGSATVAVRTAGGDRQADAVTSRRLPLSILEAGHDASMRAPRRAPSPPTSGEWIVAVWHTGGGPAFAATNVRQTATTTCGVAEVRELVSNTALNHAMIGGGVFSMDRELLGVILPCGNHVAAIEPSSVDALMKRASTIEDRLFARYGVLFGTLSEQERRYFSDAGGLLVREVWNDTSGDAAGIQPGDILVAVDDRPVSSVEDLRPLSELPKPGTELRVLRGSGARTIVLDANAAAGVPSKNGAGVGVIMQPPAPTYRIAAVAAESAAARAGVKPGDVLLRINNVAPRTRAQAERALKRPTATPTLLEVGREERRIAIVIPEAASR